MSKVVNMYAIVPVDLASDLQKKRKIKDYNTLPQLNSVALDAVREFMTENVGFSDLPMACLSLNKRALNMDSTEIFHYIPANNKESVLFQLQVPSDMIVTIAYRTLLDASAEADKFKGDTEELEFIKQDLMDNLVLGEGDSEDSEDEEIISFIPFLAYDYCKFYARFNENFETVDLEIPGVEKFSLARLSAFID